MADGKLESLATRYRVQDMATKDDNPTQPAVSAEDSQHSSNEGRWRSAIKFKERSRLYLEIIDVQTSVDGKIIAPKFKPFLAHPEVFEMLKKDGTRQFGKVREELDDNLVKVGQTLCFVIEVACAPPGITLEPGTRPYRYVVTAVDKETTRPILFGKRKPNILRDGWLLLYTFKLLAQIEFSPQICQYKMYAPDGSVVAYNEKVL